MQVQDRQDRHSLSLCVYSWIVRGKAGVVVLTLLVLIGIGCGCVFLRGGSNPLLIKGKEKRDEKEREKKKRMPPRL